MRTLLEEVSASNAIKETAAIAARARYPNSQGFFDAAADVAARARAYGLENVRIERFPQRAPKWDAAAAALELMAPVRRTLGTLETEPLLIAQRSRDGDVTAELVDEKAAEVKGKIILTSKSPDEAWRSARNRAAAALLCAWNPEYFGRHPGLDAVAWGEAPEGALVFMISPRRGEELRLLMQQGPVQLHAQARSRRAEPGEIGQVMGEIAGEVSGRDVVLVAHLDHQKPGANDNASGSGALLEALRALQSLMAAGRLPRPHRTLRFWWSTEIRSEQAWFEQHPEDAPRIALAVVLDQAGGERGAENNFVVIGTPNSEPSYADDVVYTLCEALRSGYAPAEHEPSPEAVAEGGSHQSMRAVYWDYEPLSDHVAFAAPGVGVPFVALAVPSLHVIHSSQDTLDRLDPTWMKRSAVLTLAAALTVANAGAAEVKALLETTFRRAAARIAADDDPEGRRKIEVKRLRSLRALDPSLATSAWEARLADVARAVRNPAAHIR